ncbi:MAG: glycoside hydrolase family 9 protein [Clostridiales bacterium]|nr:glycoside hydrolase family 9 protein [Clostridiales bacterium]
MLQAPGFGQIKLQPEGYFETPGFAFLLYHNDYLVGKRGGLQMFLHGKRVLDAGEVVCTANDGISYSYEATEIGTRAVDLQKGVCVVPGRIKPLDISYRIVAGSDGDAIFLTVELEKPIDWKKIRSIMLKLEAYPGEYAHKTYRGGTSFGIFQERFQGKTLLIPAAREISFAPEDDLRSFAVSSKDAELRLLDGRAMANFAGFMIQAVLPSGSPASKYSVRITPRVDPSWRRRPVIQVSQVGYHPDQKKTAVLELDSRTVEVEKIRILGADEEGRKKEVMSGKPAEWGTLFDHRYLTFDFSDVRTPGFYFLDYAGEHAGPITISKEVFNEAWHPTLDVFFPVQMCHVEVRERERVWHGACHLDDGLQAPPGTVHFDSYRQKNETETAFKANEHIPGLDWGGWHDAADYDLPSGSIAHTLLWLALAREEFQPSRDVTTIKRKERRVELFRPDGKDDFLQQVSFGVDFLLSLVRATGHVCAGVIENKISDYVVVGDPVNITDGLVYDASLKPDEKRENRSGRFDDRWVFTNRNTGGQYQLVQVAALCARVLRGFDDALAEECLKAAREIWEFEQTHPPVHFEVCYQPQEDQFHSWELSAAAELFLTTGEIKYRERLLDLIPSIEEMPPDRFVKGPGFTLVRALDRVNDERYKKIILKKAEELKAYLKEEFARSPYGVLFHFRVWGNNWDVLDLAGRLYYFIKHLPDVFPQDFVLDAVNYNFGCHPASNHSYVSGVGVNSATVVYGFNRADWTFIPGGVVSGASFLRPKFIEYRSNAWDWYETEYVIGGSAAYIFDVLAARHLLARR